MKLEDFDSQWVEFGGIYEIILILNGCTWITKDKCEFDNGRRAFMGLPIVDCKTN